MDLERLNLFTLKFCVLDPISGDLLRYEDLGFVHVFPFEPVHYTNKLFVKFDIHLKIDFNGGGSKCNKYFCRKLKFERFENSNNSHSMACKE